MDKMTALQQALSHRWRCYWYGEGFELSCSICRIATVIVMWVTVEKIVGNSLVLNIASVKQFYPKGILLFLDGPPSEQCVALTKIVFRVAAPLAIVGLFTRLTTAVAVVSFLFFGALIYSFQPGWSHGYSPQLLAALALLFAPPGKVAIDTLLARRQGRGQTPFPSCRSVVLLGQFVLAMMFFNAAIYKLYLGNGEPFGWIYSDSIRNILARQHWKHNQPVPDWLQFVIDHRWAYTTFAAAACASQLAPIIACVWPNRFLIRATAGAIWMSVVIGLGVTMGYWHLEWLALAVFFVNWDQLYQRFRRRAAIQATIGEQFESSRASSRSPSFGLALRSTWIFVVVGTYTIVAFAGRDERPYTFPLCSFPMFSDILADEPLDEHLRFQLDATEWDIDATPALPSAVMAEVHRSYHHPNWSARPSISTDYVWRYIENAYEVEIKQIHIFQSIHHISAYPETAQIEMSVALLRYSRNKSGDRTYPGSLRWDRNRDCPFITVSDRQLAATLSVVRVKAADGDKIPVAGSWQGDRFYLTDAYGAWYALIDKQEAIQLQPIGERSSDSADE